MPPLIFRAVALLVGVGGALTALFPRQMQSWRTRGMAGTTTVEPTRMRLLFTRVMGIVVAVIALLMALGDGGILLH